MSEHPILFNADMVRALNDGRKTQTRRIINWKKIFKQAGCTQGRLFYNKTFEYWVVDGNGDADICFVDCPHGKPGDTLWVRETWRLSGGPQDNRVIYKAHDETAMSFCGAAGNEGAKELDPEFGWNMMDRYGCDYRLPQHMPRWASRISLQVKKIRIERVQDISNADILAEGIAPLSEPVSTDDPWDDFEVYYAQAFHELWDSINAKRGFGWDVNPFVWVIEFERKEKDNE